MEFYVFQFVFGCGRKKTFFHHRKFGLVSTNSSFFILLLCMRPLIVYPFGLIAGSIAIIQVAVTNTTTTKNNTPHPLLFIVILLFGFKVRLGIICHDY